MSETTLVVPKAINAIPRSSSPIHLSDAPESAPSTPSTSYLDPLLLSPRPPGSRRSSISSADRLMPSRRLITQRSQPLLTVKSPLPKKTGRRGSRRSSTGTETTDTSSEFSTKYASNNKRSQDFHALFRSVPEDERLIDDYGCALQKDILVHGRIYMSEHHICFYSNIFGWITNLAISFADIENIEKRTTAIFIPNAILISTRQNKYFFASFLSRDQAYERIVVTWRASRGDVPCDEIESSVNLEKADDASWTTGIETDEDSDSDDEHIHSDPWENQVHPTMATSPIPSIVSMDESKDRTRGWATQEGVPRLQSYPRVQESSTGARDPMPDTQHTLTEASQPDTSIQKETECVCMKTREHHSIEVLNQTYHGSVEKMYQLLYHGEFMEIFLKDTEKSTDVNMGAWEKSDGNAQYTRDVSYIKYLGGAIGPKSTRCLLKEEILHLDMNDSVTLISTTQTPDVPSGSAFCIKNRTCITWAGKDTVRVLVTLLVDFSKSSWLKSTIQKASEDGQKSFYRNLDVAIRNRLQPAEPSGVHIHRRKKKGKRRHKTTGEDGKEMHHQEATSSTRLDTILTMATEGLTWARDNTKAMSLSRLSIACIVFTIVMHLFIIHKLAGMNSLLRELKGTHRHQIPPHLERASFGLDAWQRTHREDIQTMWQQIHALSEHDRPAATPAAVRYDDDAGSDASRDATTPGVESTNDAWHSHESPVHHRVEELGEMVRKAGQNVDYVSLLVEEQRQRLLQEWAK